MSNEVVLDQLGLDILEQDSPILLDCHRNNLSHAVNQLKRRKSREVIITPKGMDHKQKKQNLCVKVSFYDENAGILRFDAGKKTGWRRKFVPAYGEHC